MKSYRLIVIAAAVLSGAPAALAAGAVFVAPAPIRVYTPPPRVVIPQTVRPNVTAPAVKPGVKVQAGQGRTVKSKVITTTTIFTAPGQSVSQTCSAQATDQGFHGAARTSFLRTCVAKGKPGH